jgi:hypothetical protein
MSVNSLWATGSCAVASRAESATPAASDAGPGWSLKEAARSMARARSLWVVDESSDWNGA